MYLYTAFRDTQHKMLEHLEMSEIDAIRPKNNLAKLN